mgnify:CR=1 FL=1
MHRLHARLAHGNGTRGNAAVVFLGHRADLGHVDVAGHHQHGVGGHVPALVEVAHVSRGHGVEVAHPANHGAVVRRRDEDGGVLLLAEQGARLVFGAQSALFLDDLDLALEFVVGPLVVGEAVGFELHHLLEAADRNLLVVAGVVAGGEGVFLAAEGRHAARELAGLDVLGALEHHVFERMCNPRGAVDFIEGADPHPDHLYRRGRAPVGLHDQRHAVGQRELLGSRRGRGGGGRSGGGRCGLSLRRHGPRRHERHCQYRTRRSTAWREVFHRMGRIVKSF